MVRPIENTDTSGSSTAVVIALVPLSVSPPATADKYQDLRGLLQATISCAGGFFLLLAGASAGFISILPRSTSVKKMCIALLFSRVSALPIDYHGTTDSSNDSPQSGPAVSLISALPFVIFGLGVCIMVTLLAQRYGLLRVSGLMMATCSYVGVTVSEDTATTPAIFWTVQALGAYFLIFHGEVQFRKYQMGQGYLTLIIVLGLLVDYGIAQALQAKNSTTIRKELLQFLLPSLNLSLFFCTYYAHCHHQYNQRPYRHRDGRSEIGALQQQQFLLEDPCFEGRRHIGLQPPSGERGHCFGPTTSGNVQSTDGGCQRLNPDQSNMHGCPAELSSPL